MRVHKKYQRDRSRLAPELDKLQVYIRPDQMTWMREETLRRLGGERLTRRTSKLSELAQEAIDLLIEYERHREFMARKTVAAKQASPLATRAAGEPAARSPEPAAPGPPSSGNSGRS